MSEIFVIVCCVMVKLSPSNGFLFGKALKTGIVRVLKSGWRELQNLGGRKVGEGVGEETKLEIMVNFEDFAVILPLRVN